MRKAASPAEARGDTVRMARDGLACSTSSRSGSPACPRLRRHLLDAAEGTGAGGQFHAQPALTIAAHRAVRHDAAVRERGQRGVERVKRPPCPAPVHSALSDRARSWRRGSHQDAGRGQYAAGTELPIDRLDVGYDEAG